MLRSRKRVLLTLTVCAVVALLSATTEAGTIIKLTFGGDSAPDIEFSGGVLSTATDGVPLTTGDQNTAVEFQDFLSAVPDVLAPVASVTLDGVAATGLPVTFSGTLVLQNFSGGTLSLYDPANTLLLSGVLDDSALTGPLGSPGTGALFTTSFGTVTGGTLAPLILPGSLTFSMSFTDVNAGAGFSVGGTTRVGLDPFTADATANIAAELVPEPTAAVLLVIAIAAMPVPARRR